MSLTAYSDLRDSFFINYPQAEKGKRLLDDFFYHEDYIELATLLRHHNEEGIKDKETWLRDNVDYFLEYFSLLAIASLVHYNNEEIPFTLQEEAKYYLTDKIIKKYYSVNYPLQLPQYLLQQFKRNDLYSYEIMRTDFHRFIHLTATIKNKQVDDFLWLLDGGYKEIDIQGFNKIISDPHKLIKLLQEKDASIRKQIFLGFLQYLNFVFQYAQFLKSINPDFVLQRSAYWHYHGYWFEKTKEHMGKSLDCFFLGLKQVLLLSENKDYHVLLLNIVSKKKSEYQSSIRTIGFKKYKNPLITYIYSSDNPLLLQTSQFSIEFSQINKVTDKRQLKNPLD